MLLFVHGKPRVQHFNINHIYLEKLITKTLSISQEHGGIDDNMLCTNSSWTKAARTAPDHGEGLTRQRHIANHV